MQMLINTVCTVVNYELEMFWKILTKSFQLICKFFYMNHEWTIEEYDRRRDPAKQVEDNFSLALLGKTSMEKNVFFRALPE